jgi:hypothetical protein
MEQTVAVSNYDSAALNQIESVTDLEEWQERSRRM